MCIALRDTEELVNAHEGELMMGPGVVAAHMHALPTATHGESCRHRRRGLQCDHMQAAAGCMPAVWSLLSPALLETIMHANARPMRHATVRSDTATAARKPRTDLMLAHLGAGGSGGRTGKDPGT